MAVKPARHLSAGAFLGAPALVSLSACDAGDSGRTAAADEPNQTSAAVTGSNATGPCNPAGSSLDEMPDLLQWDCASISDITQTQRMDGLAAVTATCNRT